MDIFSEKTILTVSRLTTLLRGVLEENFEHLWVQGELSNLSSPSSGHYYFTLKDANAQIRCVMFKSSAKNLKFRLTDGMALIVRGHISVYDQRGEYQLITEYLEPAGVGALQKAFEQLKDKLSQEGLFAVTRKQPIPRFPQRVGVLTSPTGAAIHDILNVLKRRFASLEILIYPVRVQGEGSAREIATALDDMNRLAEVDVLIVGRGGGSLEDLWAFNEEAVARAVFRSQIPVISAVGHETDWTICDFVSDLRAPTPSAAAEMLIASTDELRGLLESLSHRLRLLMQNRLAALVGRLDALRSSLHDPRTLLGHLGQRMDDVGERLTMALRAFIMALRERYNRLDGTLLRSSPAQKTGALRQRVIILAAQQERMLLKSLDESKQNFGDNAARLEVLSPLKTLARGYSVASRYDNGSVVTDVAALTVGDRLRVKLYHGGADCRVESLDGCIDFGDDHGNA